jgi:hypothetical protein
VTEVHVRAARITWHDAHGSGSSQWKTLASVSQGVACEVTTIGFIVDPSLPGHVTVVQTVNPHSAADAADAECLHEFHIPLGMVVDIEFFDDPA